jgi:hypothetical protein
VAKLGVGFACIYRCAFDQFLFCLGRKRDIHESACLARLIACSEGTGMARPDSTSDRRRSISAVQASSISPCAPRHARRWSASNTHYSGESFSASALRVVNCAATMTSNAACSVTAVARPRPNV